MTKGEVDQVVRAILQSEKCGQRDHDDPADFQWNCGDCLRGNGYPGTMSVVERRREAALRSVITKATNGRKWL